MLLKNFKTALRDAVQKSPRIYSKIHSATFRWELDDSNAERDTQHFQDLTRALGFEEPAEEHIIGKDSPHRAVFDIAHAAAKRGSRGDRILIVIHYAGHAELNGQDQLIIFENHKSSRGFHAKYTFWSFILQDPNPPSLDHIDFLLIFDSWFGGLAPRAPPGTSRIIEVLAAANIEKASSQTDIFLPSTHPSNPRTQKQSFTSKLAKLVTSRKGRALSMGFSEMISELKAKSPAPGPHHCILLGPKSIRLPLPMAKWKVLGSPKPKEPANTKPYTALFSFHAREERMTSDKRDEVADSIEAISIKEIAVRRFYRAKCSTTFILQAPYYVFLNISGWDGVNLIYDDMPLCTIAEIQDYRMEWPQWVVEVVRDLGWGLVWRLGWGVVKSIL